MSPIPVLISLALSLALASSGCTILLKNNKMKLVPVAGLGRSPHEIPILIAKGLLEPLGHPAPNAPKFFLTATIDDLRRDEKWHGKVVDAIQDYWHYKNGRKQEATENRQTVGA